MSIVNQKPQSVIDTKIAVIGATGAVGRQMVKELQSSPLFDNINNNINRSKSMGSSSTLSLSIGLFASQRSHGTKLRFFNQDFEVQAFDIEKLRDYHYVLLSAGGDFSREYGKLLAQAGLIVIDNSSAWRSDPEVPLIVPEVNFEDRRLQKLINANFDNRNGGIISNPNCSTIQLMMSIAPLYKHYGISKIFVSTYQSVSGTGQKGINELHNQVYEIYQKLDKNHDFDCFVRAIKDLDYSVYSQPIAFNLISGIGGVNNSGFCEEEIKMINESKKILDDQSLDVLATTVRVPVFYGHGQSVVCELKSPVSYDDVYQNLNNASGVYAYQRVGSCFSATPHQTMCNSTVFVSRIRLGVDPQPESSGNTKSNWFQSWNVCNNLTKGAAFNAVQILQLIEKKIKRLSSLVSVD